MSKVGFLPCFSRYLHKKYPVKDLYQKDALVKKLQVLVSAFISSPDQLSLKEQIGGHQIQTIRPDSQESIKIIRLCNSSDCSIHRVDYGNTPFRIVFGLSNTDRNAFIFMIDPNHKTYG